MSLPAYPDFAVKFQDACKRLGVSVRQGHDLVKAGRFPIPALPSLNTGQRHQFRRYSSHAIDMWLADSPLEPKRGLKRAG